MVLRRGRHGDLGSVRIAIDLTVVDDQLRDVIANEIRGEVSDRRQGVEQHRLATRWLADERPAETQRVVVGIGRTAAIQQHGRGRGG